MIMKKIITASMLSLLLGGTVQAQSLPVYLDDSKPIEDRIEDALSRITVEEKVALIHAQSKFSSPGVARLGIPEFWTVRTVSVPKCYGMSGTKPDGPTTLALHFRH